MPTPWPQPLPSTTSTATSARAAGAGATAASAARAASKSGTRRRMTSILSAWPLAGDNAASLPLPRGGRGLGGGRAGAGDHGPPLLVPPRGRRVSRLPGTAGRPRLRLAFVTSLTSLEPVTPAVGWGVLHLFLRAREGTDTEAVVAAVKACQADEHQVITFAVLGHKADIGLMALGPDLWRLRRLQTEVVAAGLELADS